MREDNVRGVEAGGQLVRMYNEEEVVRWGYSLFFYMARKTQGRNMTCVVLSGRAVSRGVR